MVRETCLIIGVIEAVIQFLHGLEDGTEGLNDVAENNGFPFEPLMFGKALRIDELHLFQDGRFARLAGACRSHKGQ